MSTEFFLATELASLAAPFFALLGALVASDRWSARFLIIGQISAFTLALIGLTLSILQHLTVPQLAVYGAISLRSEFATACLLAGISFIAAVVTTFSERYLAGDNIRRKFLCCMTFLSSCAACLVLSNNIWLSLLCWNLLSWTLWYAMHLQAPASRSAATVLKHHILSDVTMFLALFIITHSTGVTTFSQLTRTLVSLDDRLNFFGLMLPFEVGTVACLLMVIAFSIKSGLFPFHRWLLATLDAPTPLSGLLHAGVVNVSAIMAWRLMPVLQEHTFALAVWAIVGTISAILGTLSMSAQPTLKRKLVYSTVGQMGFMSLQCAAGAIGAGLFHVLAHGLFKCYLFLQSGGAVREGLDKRKYAYSSDTKHDDRLLKNSLVMFLCSLVLCSASYSLSSEHHFTVASALIAACAVISTVPSCNRINLNNCILALSIMFLAVLASVVAGTSLEHSLQIYSLNTWLLPASLAVFALVSVALRLFANTTISKALYVHSLNGFYMEQLAAASHRKGA